MFKSIELTILTGVCFVCVYCAGLCFSQETPVVNKVDEGSVGAPLSKDELTFAVPKDYKPSSDILEGRLTEAWYKYDREVFEAMKKEEYEKVISIVEKRIVSKLDPIDVLWKNDSNPEWSSLGEIFGQDLSLLAEALEYSGKRWEAENVLKLFSMTKSNDQSLSWFHARLSYSEKNNAGVLFAVNEAVYQDYVFWNLDAALARSDVGQVARLNSREHRLWEADRKAVYRLKDKCVRVICPNFHWKYNDRLHTASDAEKEEILKQFDRYFQEFMELIESEFAKLPPSEKEWLMERKKSTEGKDSKENEEAWAEEELLDEIPEFQEHYIDLIEQFRKLAQFP